MTEQYGLSDADRHSLAKALLSDRYATLDPAAHQIHDLVTHLLQFTPGEVPPDEPSAMLGGVPLAGPTLDERLDGRLGTSRRRKWPDGAPMAIAITHDVDLFDGLSFFGLRAAGWLASGTHALLTGQVGRARTIAKRALQWSRWRMQGTDPVNDISAWQALEAEHNIRSTFFFLSLQKALSKEGRLYGIDDSRVRRVLHSLYEGGWEVGLHAARYESDSAFGLERQRIRLENALGHQVNALRYHYLTANFPAAWRHMADAGFTISSNVGFHPPYQGFRTGTAWPYRPLAHEGSPIIEVPMALMDVAHGPARSQLFNFFQWLVEQTRKVGGLLVINFHTNYVAEIDAPGVHRQFKDIVMETQRLVSEGEAVTLTMSQVADHILKEKAQSGSFSP